MTNKNFYLLFVSIFFALIGHRCYANDLPQKYWCIVYEFGAKEGDMLKFMNFACSSIVDCGAIKLGGGCYQADNLAWMASFVLNSYYRLTGTCWNELGILWPDDPSYGNCHYL
ncbi:glucan endo-1,3-beta-glucosidase-like [Henckelia pumila]|uniref:glucan endo-1,3-beta-glucosidase-like n=1 Tax=Henckelia pumila TaxID=405737 RepID=UPI003C6E1728